MKTIPFTIEAYKTGKYDVKTRGEEPVEIKITDGRYNGFPVVGYLGRKDSFNFWSKTGCFDCDGTASINDLVLVSKEPTIRPWSGPKEVPFDAWFARKEWTPMDGTKFRLIGVGTNGVSVSACGQFETATFAELLDTCVHSIDQGKTWLPCGVEE